MKSSTADPFSKLRAGFSTVRPKRQGKRFAQDDTLTLLEFFELTRMPLELPAPESVERRPEEDDRDADQRLFRSSDDGVQRPSSCHQEVQRRQIRVPGAAIRTGSVGPLAAQNKQRTDTCDIRQ